MKVKTLLLGVLLVLCGCTATENKHSSTKEETPQGIQLPHEAYDLPAADVIRERVISMYNDVFDHYNREDDASFDYTKYFSNSLLNLWHELPEDDQVIDVDPWIQAQDNDSLVCTKVEAMVWGPDSARAWVSFNNFGNPQTVQLKLVREQHADKDTADWYVADFNRKDFPDEGSVASTIRDYIKIGTNTK